MTTQPQGHPYSVRVETDPQLDSTVISLVYDDPTNAARSMLVSVAPELGSNMFRFRVGEHELISTDRALLKNMDFTGNFVLWPWPNRIRNARYSYRGHEYSLETLKQERRPQGNAPLIHGLVFDRVWHYNDPVVGAEAVSVTTFVEITLETPYFAGYPFPSRLSLTYTLTGSGIAITYEVQNMGTDTLPFGFALHPYFATLSGDQTQVSIPADAVMEADDELLPTGRVFDVDKVMYAMYDLRRLVPVGSLKLDHVYTRLHPGEPARIDYPDQHLQLEIGGSEDFTHAVIYVPGGQPFFCLEHQTCSTDAPNLAARGPAFSDLAHLLEVEPGGVFTGTLHYRPRFL